MDPTYRPIIGTAKVFFKALGLRIDCQGSDNVPRQGGAVLAINHTSFLDFIFAGVPADQVGGRLVRYMAKKEVFDAKGAGTLMRSMKHIPVDRSAGAGAFQAAVDSLRSGELVGVFPEATMSRSFDIKECKTGAARMAFEAEVPLLPVIVFGGQRIMGYGHRDLSRGKAISITVGEPVATSSDFQATTDALRARMIELLDETVARYPDKPASAEDAWWMPSRLGGAAPTIEEAESIEAEVKAARAAKREAKKRA